MLSSSKSPQSRPPSSDTYREIIGLIRSIALFVAIALMLRVSVVEAFKIPSSSMENTLHIGDHILVNKLSYGLWINPFSYTMLFQFREPSRGDVVVFTRPDDPATREDESDVNIIKRIIGTPGDEVEVRETTVLINGKVNDADAEYAQWLLNGEKNFGPKKVPPGKVLLLGDNRDYSKDSRYWPDPFLDMRRIKGRAFIIYLSYNSGTQTFDFSRIFNIIR